MKLIDEVPQSYGIVRVVRLELHAADFVHARFDAMDNALLEDCQHGSIADKLLGLELIARRVEEAYARRRATPPPLP
jgi:hypothetical protein